MIHGETLFADVFGNLVTNVNMFQLLTIHNGNLRVYVGNPVHQIRSVRTHGEAENGQCVALIGSSGRLEISVVGRDASKLFASGTTFVEIRW